MIWTCDTKNKITYVNQPWVNFTGVDLDKIKHVGWLDLVHPSDREEAKGKFNMQFSERLPVTIVCRLRQNDGQFRWVQENGKPRFLCDGSFIGYIGSVIDIHDQKQKEELLQEQSIIIENISDIIVTTDIDFKVQSWNKIAEKYYEIQALDAIGKPMGLLVHFNYFNTSSAEAANELRVKGIWKGEVSFQDKKGETFYFQHTVQYRYDHKLNKVGFISIGRDITERRRTKGKLEESEKFYRNLIAHSLDATLLMEESGQITFASASVKNILGYDAEDLVGKSGFDFVHPEDAVHAFNSFQKEVIEQPEIKFIIIRLLKKNGEWLWCMVRGHNMLQNPHVKSIVVFFHDDTPRKKANDALKASEKRFRDLIRELQIGIILLDRDKKIILCNEAFTDITLTSEKELIGKDIFEVGKYPIHENGKPYKIEERPTFRTLLYKKPVKDVVIGILQPKTQKRIWLMINVDPLLDENGEVFQVICSVKDITERKRMEEDILSKQINHQKQLTQATLDGQEKERTEIGKELHDNIGQQLTTIKLFLDMAKSTADDTTNEMVSMALKGVSDVINEVRSMSRSLVPFTLKDLGLIESINELIDSIKRTLKLHIEFDHAAYKIKLLQQNQKLTLFRIVQEQLNNIVKHSKASNVIITLKNDGKMVTLQIKDNGQGFDINKIRKGIGFINIKNRAELFGGTAQVISQPGEGCLVSVNFPHVTILPVI
jgi:PAS domain S-box-containing protein